MNELMILSTVLSPIVLALVQLLKKLSTENNRLNHLLPLMALAVGLLVGLISAPFSDLEWTLRMWAGGIAGLAAVGLFEIADNTTDKEVV